MFDFDDLDLGSRAPPRHAWVAVAAPLDTRALIKQKRRKGVVKGAGLDCTDSPSDPEPPCAADDGASTGFLSALLPDLPLTTKVVSRSARRQRGNVDVAAVAAGGATTVGGMFHRGGKSRQQHVEAANRRAVEARAASRAAAAAAGKSGIFSPGNDECTGGARRLAEPRDMSLMFLCHEVEEGNVEYKYRIKDPHAGRLQQLITQMKFRLSEGNGECYYYIGVEDDGYPRGLEAADLAGSIATLEAMAASLGATASLVRYLPGAGAGRRCVLQRVKLDCIETLEYADLRIAVAGSLSAGKSTLVAVLTCGSDGRPRLDSGRGSARMGVLRHKHEIESGRTSSISRQLVGYDQEGRVINYAGVAAPTPAEICSAAVQVCTFIDLGGHPKCLKTALYGMTCLLPDYALVLVAADAPVPLTTVTCEHLAVAVALEVPVALVLTKVDLVDASRVAEVVRDMRSLLLRAMPALAPLTHAPADGEEASLALKAAVPVMCSEAEATACAAALSVDRRAGEVPHKAPALFPIFPVSSVTGSGLSVLHAYIRALEPAVHRRGATRCSPPAGGTLQRSGAAGDDSCRAGETDSCAAVPVPPVHFQVDQTFEVDGVGSVVSGTVVAGAIETGQRLMFGPNCHGAFQAVTVSSIQRSHIPVSSLRSGQTATIALQPVADWPMLTGATLQPPTPGTTSDSQEDVCHTTTSLSAVNDGMVVNGSTVAVGGTAAVGVISQVSQRSDVALGLGADSNAADLKTAVSGTVDHDLEESLLDDVAEAMLGGGTSSAGGTDVEEDESDSDQAAGHLRGRRDVRGKARVPPARGLRHAASEGHAAWAHIKGAAEGCRDRAAPLIRARHAASDNDALHHINSGMEWELCVAATSPPRPAVVPCSPSPSRKGSVLLDERLYPSTAWELEADLVLLGGRWPARGLLSGHWPPSNSDVSDGAGTASEGGGGTAGGTDSGVRSAAAGRVARCKKASHERGGGGGCHGGSDVTAVVVHCGSVRQAARVVWMQELFKDGDMTGGGTEASLRWEVGGSSVRAAAALLQPDVPDGVGPAACVVRMRFLHRPEWVQAGQRLLVRDRDDGRVAGAGFVVRGMDDTSA